MNETHGGDVTAGVYWAVSSMRRCVSYGSQAFFLTANTCSPDMNFPAYNGYNPSKPWCTDGQGFMKLDNNIVEDWAGDAAIRSNGQLHVTDCVFNLNKRKIKEGEAIFALLPFNATKDPTEKPFQNSSTPWPLLLGYNELHPDVTFSNNTWPLNYTMRSPGSCARVNLSSSDVFFKPDWVQEGSGSRGSKTPTFFNVADLLGLEILQVVEAGQAGECATTLRSNGMDITGLVTQAVEMTITAAREASAANPKITSLDGAPVAYFPRGCYAMNKKLNITGNNYYIEGAGGLQTAFDYVGPVQPKE